MADDTSDLLLNYHDACVYRSDLRLLDSPTEWLNDACIHFQLTRIAQKQQRRRRQASSSSSGENERDICVGPAPDLFLDPSVVSFAMHQCDDDDLEDLARGWDLNKKGRVFVPVNDHHAASADAFRTPGGGSHWSMLVVLLVGSNDASPSSSATASDGTKVTATTRTAKFLHFDSAMGLNERAARAVARRIRRAIAIDSSPSAGIEKEASAVVVECRTPQQTNGHDCGVFALGVAEALSSSGGSLAGGDVTAAALEEALASFVADRGGGADFAKNLRQTIASDIRQLSEKR